MMGPACVKRKTEGCFRCQAPKECLACGPGLGLSITQCTSMLKVQAMQH